MNKVAAIYQLAKDLPLNQLTKLQEMIGGVIQAATLPYDDCDCEDEELAIERRLIEKRILVLPYGTRRIRQDKETNQTT